MSIPASFSALSDEDYDNSVAHFLMIEQRQKQKNSVGCILSLLSIDPCIPENENDLKKWLLDALLTLSPEVKARAEQDFFNIRAKIFWLVLNVDTPSGKAWVGVRLVLDNKRAFPLSYEKMKSWKIDPFFVEAFNKELMLPRSGANPLLDKKKVLLFGCGSVGSEIAHKLGASGIGHIDIVDPDIFTTSNLYRHTLDGKMTNWPKAQAVSIQLQAKFPWLKTNAYLNYLLNYRNADFLSSYDLIIVAIGSPTHERIFHDYLVKSRVKVPIIYSWLEGYGIGGHSVIDIPNKKGCLRCAYVESNTGIRGLSSNLNFLEPNQNIVKNYAGCGEMFIPYGAISSAQTALIAADLAIGYLEGKLVESSKVSWKGDSSDSTQQDLKLTPRYIAFSSSLKKQPLVHPLCDICHPEEMVVYRSPSGKSFFLPSTIHQELCTYRQEEKSDLESAGLLIGCYKQNGDILVDRFTRPKTTDQRTRSTFKLDAQAHQLEIEKAYTNSDQLLGYIGTWHTHPQNIPVPSSIDFKDWRSHERDNPTRLLFFIVVGLTKTSVYTIENNDVIELTK
ncbi:hypothetical protein A8139_06420 [Marinomonas primoryensis]|uniref:Thiamine biosynthesis protein ThiF n=1 Tax=Marinomonas primoryensis TaxID=178399 RepID=A0A2Z4PQB7_9GAMM|nr:ThiF family adenylyltransferase [Marinomonas primoryensis]AWX99672.1 hypothetical protein A8139_06420 [Marinomonas primoryensis]